MSNVSSSNSQAELVPKLRFPEFQEEWSKSELGSIGSFCKGAALSKADISDNGTPFILYGELYTTYNEVTYTVHRRTKCSVDNECYSKVGDVIIPTSGETPEEIATSTCVMIPNVILAGDLNIYRNTKIDGRFLSYIINHIVNNEIARTAQGKSIVHIKANELAKISVRYPSSLEQSKILSLFELLDKRIDKQKAYIEVLKSYKRGLLSYIFSSQWTASKSHCKWTQSTISDLLSYEQPQKYIVLSEHYSDKFITPVLTANKAFILGYTNEQNGIYNKGNVIIYDDFTMDFKYVTFDFKVKSSTIKMLTSKGKNDLFFLYSLLQSLRLTPEGHQRSYISIVAPKTVYVPDIETQHQISHLLGKFSKYIEISEKILDRCLIVKQGLLSRIFI